MLFNCSILNAFDNISFLSPGLKLGYVFGKDGGFVYGFELSYVYWINSAPIPLAAGPVFKIDFFNGTTKTHIGFEALNLVGIGFGPTYISNEKFSGWGFSVIGFGGLLIYPYYNFTSVGGKNFDEVGSYFKLPILTSGRITF